MEVKERIKAILDCYNLSVNEFVAQTGVKTGQAIYDLLSGKTKSISPSMRDKILSCYTDIDKVWLLTGEGEMLKRAQTITGDGNIQVAGNAHNVNAGKTLDAALREVENAHNIISKMQLQMDTLLTVIEKLTDQKK